MGKDIANDLESLKQAITSIVETDYTDDGVEFNSETIKVIPIAEKNLYNGVRVTIEVKLDTIRQNMQIDIGFGDVIVPKALDLTYPVLLDELSVPALSAYTIETVIAEKFQAMIALSTLNSRMKDFYDVFHLLAEPSINKENLKNALIETFKNRATELPEEHTLFTDAFWNDLERAKMWNAFLKKINHEYMGAFKEIMKTITESLLPIIKEINASI